MVAQGKFEGSRGLSLLFYRSLVDEGGTASSLEGPIPISPRSRKGFAGDFRGNFAGG